MFGLHCVSLRVNAAFFAAAALVLALAANGAEAQDRVRPKLGVSLRDLSPEAAAHRGVPFPGGLEVGAVYEGSPAKAAGMLSGDVIFMANGRKIYDTLALLEELAHGYPGTPVRLSVLRAGKAVHLPVMLWGPPPSGPSNMPAMRQAEAPQTQAGGKPWLGVSTASLAPEEAFDLGFEQPGAAKVVSVAKGSPADEMGLKPGDVITGLDDEPVFELARPYGVFGQQAAGIANNALDLSPRRTAESCANAGHAARSWRCSKGAGNAARSFSFREAGRGGETAASGRPPGAGGEACRCAG